MYQDKRGISTVQLAVMLGTTYKTAWFMLMRIRAAMGQRDGSYQLSGVIEFDDVYFGGPTTGKKRGRGTEKAKVFVALSLDERGNPPKKLTKVFELIDKSPLERGTGAVLCMADRLGDFDQDNLIVPFPLI